MRATHWLVTMLSMMLPAAAAAQPPGMFRVVRTVAVLEEPRADAKAIGTVAPGEILERLDERPEWVLVRPPGESPREWRTGWIGRSAVEPFVLAAESGPGSVTAAVPAPQAASRRDDRVRLELGAAGGVGLGLASLAAEYADAFATGLQLGGARNLQIQTGSPVKWLAGGHGGVRIVPDLFVVGEVLVNRIASPRASGTVVGQSFDLGATATFSEYTGGILYVLGRGRVAPYARAALGVIRLTVNADSPQLASGISLSLSDITWNVGGGVHFGSTWGVRPDVRVVRVPEKTFLRTSVGIVYQLR